jgi:hypothetical protein
LLIEKIQAITAKHTTELRELHRAGDEDGLAALLFELSWLHVGIADDLEDEEAMEEHADSSDEWHLAKYEVLRTLTKLDDLVDATQAALNNPQVADHVVSLHRKRAKSA